MNSSNAAARVGGRLLIGFQGTTADEAAGLLERFRPGGLVLLPRNVVSVTQVAELVGGLQARARDLGLPRLLVAVDQEGGAIARLDASAGFTEVPSAMAVGKTGDPGMARELGEMVGRELAAVGVDLALAPVLDLALDPRNEVIGSRSYGRGPKDVGRFGAAAVEGLHAAGVLACGKHFPGHGATASDSHLELPRLDSSLEEIRGRDLTPFRVVVDSGCDAVMTAHVMSAFDAVRPATLSRPTLTGVLRGELGFERLILTDALEMRALASVNMSRPRCAVEALRAGADLVVFEGDLELIEASAAALNAALDEGDLDEVAWSASEARLETARQALAGRHPSFEVIGRPRHVALALRAAEAGLEVRDPLGILPLRRTPVLLDMTASNGVAAALGWPAVERADAAAGRAPLVVALDGRELHQSDRELLAGLARGDRDVVALVLGGWQLPAGTEATATVLAFDLPRSLWTAISRRLTSTRTQAHSQRVAPRAVT